MIIARPVASARDRSLTCSLRHNKRSFIKGDLDRRQLTTDPSPSAFTEHLISKTDRVIVLGKTDNDSADAFAVAVSYTHLTLPTTPYV